MNATTPPTTESADVLLLQLADAFENASLRTQRERQSVLDDLEERLRKHAAELYSADQLVRDTIHGRTLSNPTECALHALACWHYAHAALLAMPRRDDELEHKVALRRIDALERSYDVALERFGAGILWEAAR